MDSNTFYKKIQECGYKCSILIENDNILFLAKDIATIFNIKQIHTSILKYNIN